MWRFVALAGRHADPPAAGGREPAQQQHAPDEEQRVPEQGVSEHRLPVIPTIGVDPPARRRSPTTVVAGQWLIGIADCPVEAERRGPDRPTQPPAANVARGGSRVARSGPSCQFRPPDIGSGGGGCRRGLVDRDVEVHLGFCPTVFAGCAEIRLSRSVLDSLGVPVDAEKHPPTVPLEPPRTQQPSLSSSDPLVTSTSPSRDANTGCRASGAERRPTISSAPVCRPPASGSPTRPTMRPTRHMRRHTAARHHEITKAGQPI